MKNYILFWRAHGGASGDVVCRAGSPSEAISHFRKTLNAHSLHSRPLRRVFITGIAEDCGRLSLQLVQA